MQQNFYDLGNYSVGNVFQTAQQMLAGAVGPL